MSKKDIASARTVLAELQQKLDTHVEALARASVTGKARQQLLDDVAEIEQRLTLLREAVDPIKNPKSIFDPANPNVVGRFVALALVAQERLPLRAFDRFYGSGVYAIYYTGDFDLYAPISATETPIYVGKADPKVSTAITPADQGDKLSGRLLEHKKSIETATNLTIDDFECRALVVQSGWQTAAEDYLISVFNPIWNNETKILFGIGKHGDSANTRKNKRSPWDVLHPGRPWAMKTTTLSSTEPEIRRSAAAHFAAIPAFTQHQDVLDAFVSGLKQG